MKHEQPVRRDILILLKKNPCLNTIQIGKALGITSSGARQQLSQLEKGGLVASEFVPQKAGRPVLYYQLTPAAEAYFPQDYVSLIMSFLAGLEEITSRSKVEEVLRVRCIKLLQKYWDQFGNSPLEERIRILAKIRDQEGFMSEVESRENDYLLIEYNCPILCVAKEYPEICRLELDLLRQVLQTPVERIEHRTDGHHACAYSIKKPKE